VELLVEDDLLLGMQAFRLLDCRAVGKYASDRANSFSLIHQGIELLRVVGVVTFFQADGALGKDLDDDGPEVALFMRTRGELRCQDGGAFDPAVFAKLFVLPSRCIAQHQTDLELFTLRLTRWLCTMPSRFFSILGFS
jgi:hypothetical protein